MKSPRAGVTPIISPRRIRPSIVLGLLAGCGVLLGGCAELPPRPELPAESALPAGQTTRLDQGFGPLEAAHPGESGFMLLIEGTEAFAELASLLAPGFYVAAIGEQFRGPFKFYRHEPRTPVASLQTH